MLWRQKLGFFYFQIGIAFKSNNKQDIKKGS